MKTYQDLLAVGEDEKERMLFINGAINDHKQSDLYRVSVDADCYYRHLNPTIMEAQKIIYDALGIAHVDKWSANNKIPSRMFFYFTTQAVQFLLGNGVSFKNAKTKERFTSGFDSAIQKAATRAIVCGVSFGYLNREESEVGSDGTYSVSVFDPLDFVPLVDEETSALRAGIRFWQLPSKGKDKPMRAVLYEENGYTEYIKEKASDWRGFQEKRPYIQVVATSDVAGTEIVDGKNYPGFPIVPLWNINKQSDLIGSRATLDAYDLMASQLVNNVDEGNLIYWVIKNAGGMNASDVSKFIRQLHMNHVALVEGEEDIDPHTINVPVQASETALARLRSQLFDDFMALDTKEISGGAVTATQIKAAYEPLNSKTDLFEYQVTDFILGLLKLIKVEDQPTYTRSMIVNQSEMITNLIAANTVLPADYVTRKIVELLGDTDKAEAVLKQMDAEDMGRFDNEEG